MEEALAVHDGIVGDVMASHGGFVFAATGDGFAVAFARASDAVTAAVALQDRVRSECWPEPVSMQVRVGLHTGEAQERDGNYFGPSVNRAARVMTAATGSQILVSGTTAEVLGGRGEFELVPLGRRRLRGLTESMAVLAVRADGLVEAAPPEERRGNLPAVTTPLVGQHVELNALRDILRSAPLVTLTGAGGVGKTRLALEAARSVVDDYPDGAWLVDLAPLTTPDSVLPAITTLFETPTEGRSLRDGIVQWMQGRRMLVVIDNAEHVLEPVADFAAAVIGWAPSVVLLVTSREALGVAGERVWPVRTLDPAGEASELFRNVASAADATVILDADDAEPIEAICHLLDGLPLAIELAAARCRSMRPAEILARLEDRFSLLRASAVGVGERHQTLTNTVEWSYQLLEEREQRVFDRASVFAGGFTLDAAEAVCVGEPVLRADVVDLVGTLVDKSMLLAEPAGDHTRYRLLETLRQYGQARLAEEDDSASTAVRHAAFYADEANWRSERALASDVLESAWLSAEWDNLRAAHARSMSTRDTDRAAVLAVSVGEMAFTDLRFEHIATAYATLERIGDHHPAARRLWTLVAQGHMMAGEPQEALAEIARALALPTTDDTQWQRRDRRATFWAWFERAGVSLHLGRYDDAVAAVDELAHHTDGEPTRELNLAYIRLGVATGHENQQMPELAVALEAAARAFPPTSKNTQAMVAFGYAMAAMAERDFATARAEFERQRDLVRGTHGHRELEALGSIAQVAAAMRADDAEATFSEAIFEHFDRRYWSYLWILLQDLAMYWARVGKREQAAVLVGHLGTQGVAHAMWHGRFDACSQELRADPTLQPAIQHGETMSREELGLWTLEELPPIAI
jgi:predicted ATPase